MLALVAEEGRLAPSYELMLSFADRNAESARYLVTARRLNALLQLGVDGEKNAVASRHALRLGIAA
eukprot:CAMPEP_0185614748 /NCGR_PEP_ID=MMETSP0436-20130131/33083_1 /TAXON_ID=626734 ORGANISM="Favella taraikaensis, Strain Fe Narragansett Bay" /NCGR_SAMPLE_ID=MMETSP0436 /ASSEMBLY_ACC=CAM_ASM_000390 /LENGTH=65 /DNA_ID=CAMNT_0028249871 /DNA_START=447 /DNA_END=644 /DNA_ORIENTATION=+